MSQRQRRPDLPLQIQHREVMRRMLPWNWFAADRADDSIWFSSREHAQARFLAITDLEISPAILREDTHLRGNAMSLVWDGFILLHNPSLPLISLEDPSFTGIVLWSYFMALDCLYRALPACSAPMDPTDLPMNLLLTLCLDQAYAGHSDLGPRLEDLYAGQWNYGAAPWAGDMSGRERLDLLHDHWRRTGGGALEPIFLWIVTVLNVPVISPWQHAPY